ncbi:type VI secretion system baseplate subunit TssE [Uliginosibacterium aquaticum]|uniref:Type VI secretion system baseplate subunit TssE n=1 Tax=Uliginosibacterium aquaticum TaxID=2731212 RepID=A0ABX2IQU8_9RHOO|nr:type VI secretion system baseplate subunit TssE [Uliginosibacterium aquaticum]NSL57084.1 type VI secretion system baseplate subunit TssE [Uliginosibacterium aquaticum]
MAGFLPTLFERLRDDAPHRSAETDPMRRWSVDELKESVAHDLESLLNSRAALFSDSFERFPESHRSVASYGMGDFVGLSLANPADRDLICRTLERTIAHHEPRLRQVDVRLEADRSSIGCLQFGINAVLYVNPASEPVTFDALLQPNTLQYSVAKSRGLSGVR